MNTKPPWHHNRHNGKITDQHGHIIAQVRECTAAFAKGEAEANGELIAAAPDMLETLEEILADCPCDYESQGGTCGVCAKILQVTQKAKGKK